MLQCFNFTAVFINIILIPFSLYILTISCDIFENSYTSMKNIWKVLLICAHLLIDISQEIYTFIL